MPRTSGAELKDEGNLAITYVGMGRYEEAEQLLTNSLQDIDGIELRARRAYRRHLGEIYREQGKYAAAEDALLETLNSCRQLPGKDHPFTLRHVNGLGVLRTQQGQYEEAKTLSSRAAGGRKTKLGPDHPHTLETVHELGMLYVAKEDHEKAEPLLTDAFHGREAKLGPEHPHTIESLRELLRLYEAWPKPDEAAKWRAKLGEMKPTAE